MLMEFASDHPFTFTTVIVTVAAYIGWLCSVWSNPVPVYKVDGNKTPGYDPMKNIPVYTSMVEDYTWKPNQVPVRDFRKLPYHRYFYIYSWDRRPKPVQHKIGKFIAEAEKYNLSLGTLPPNQENKMDDRSINAFAEITKDNHQDHPSVVHKPPAAYVGMTVNKNSVLTGNHSGLKTYDEVREWATNSMKDPSVTMVILFEGHATATRSEAPINISAFDPTLIHTKK